MTHNELVKRLAQQYDRPEGEVKVFLSEVIAEITDLVTQGEKVVLQGFLTFTPKEQGERTYNNPHTNQPITVAPKTVVKVAVSSVFKRRIEGK